MMEPSRREEAMAIESLSASPAAAAMGLSLVDLDRQEHEHKGESGVSMQFAPQHQQDEEEICVMGAAATKTPRCVLAVKTARV